ncbi:MAG TPA: NRDE family protein [Candidatus Sulfotelmatobacter sp.]|nr:NRDE family protein [Candidatus Sulfotelmatobacter sp.]
MCTVVFGWNALGSDTLLLAANRDEDPRRPSAGPRRLHESPRVVGGMDLTAGGTWLAIRERRSLVAVLNRRDPDRISPPPRRRSRGLLALQIAASGNGDPRVCAEAARLLLGADLYAPCSLLIAGPEAALLVSHAGGGPPRVEKVAAGWHVITHQELDDASEPRAAWLASELARFTPRDRDEAERQLDVWLASHGNPGPPVCLHEGPVVTVSTSRVWLAADGVGYRHGEGPAHAATWTDWTTLITEN